MQELMEYDTSFCTLCKQERMSQYREFEKSVDILIYMIQVIL